MMAFQMWDLYRREVISEKVDIWVSAKHMNMSIWPLGYMSLNLNFLSKPLHIMCYVLHLIIRDRQIKCVKSLKAYVFHVNG